MSEDKRVGKRAIRGRASQFEKGVSLERALDMFFQAKSAEGLRKRTLDDYRCHLRYLGTWLNQAHPEITTIQDVSSTVLHEYVYYLSHDKPRYDGHPFKSDREKERKGLAPGAVNVRLSTLKALFRWLHAEEIIATNPARNLKKQRVDEDQIGAFTDEQVELLLSQPDLQSYSGFRDYVMMRLMLETGMRAGEVMSLTLSDIDFKSRLITLTGDRNKNRRIRVIPFSTEMGRLLNELAAESRAHFPTEEHVFLANYGEPIAQQTINHRIKEYGVQAGIAGQVRCSPHTFRHTFAKNFLMAGADIIALQRILGHSSMEMVRKYVQHRPEDLREAHDLFSSKRVTVRRRK